VGEYKVIAGRYQIDGGDVVIENPMGRGTMQNILDHYSNEGFELVDSNFDNINHEVILTLCKGASVAVAAPSAAAPVAYAQPAAAVVSAPDDDDLPPRRRASSGGGKRRRSKAELDRLYRD
jgi:hypothetical protein